MKSFSHVVRRTHLYLTLLCLPWFLMYGITAMAFSHAQWFSANDDLYNLSSPNWSKVRTWSYSIELPSQEAVPREVGAELLQAASLPVRAFSVGRWGPHNIAVYINDVWQIRRLMYDMESQQLILYHRKPDARIFLASLHSRAGYRHSSLANDVWAVMVDLVSIGILIWVASGIFIWWQQRHMRRAGLVALLLGCAAFVAFMFAL